MPLNQETLNSSTTISVPAGMKKLVVILFLGRNLPMGGKFSCALTVSCVLCQVTLFLLASDLDTKKLANLSNLKTQNRPLINVIVTTSFITRQVGKSCRGGAAVSCIALG